MNEKRSRQWKEVCCLCRVESSESASMSSCQPINQPNQPHQSQRRHYRRPRRPRVESTQESKSTRLCGEALLIEKPPLSFPLVSRMAHRFVLHNVPTTSAGPTKIAFCATDGGAPSEGGTSSDNAYISWSYSPPSSVGWSLTSRTLLSITYRSLEQGMPEYTKISFASDYLHRGLTCSADGIVMSTTIPGRFSVPVDVAVGHIRGVCKSLASGLVPSKSAPKGSRRRMSYERRYWREML